jgi:multiple sugar transport system substrate-binding protein
MMDEAGRDLVQGFVEGRLSRRRFAKRALAAGLSAGAVGALLRAEGVAAVPSAQDIELLFTVWGSPNEKAAQQAMVDSFNETHPGIGVRMQHIPDEYLQKMSTMLAGGQPPDIGYLDGSTAFRWAGEGTLLDLTPYFAADPTKRLERAYYRYGDNKVLGTNTAVETLVLFYNKELFDDAGIAYPPSRAEAAWGWDQFVETAKKLTKDRQGRDATNPEFDPGAIQTYGVAFPTDAVAYIPLIYSNGGRFADDAGTELLLNKPEAVEVLQQMADLIYVHHVAPTPAQTESLPATDVMMKSRKVAMDMNGHWKTIDYSQSGLSWDFGVLPRFKEPRTIIFGSPTVIFAKTEAPDQAYEFYKYHNDPAQVDLFRKGLWMPLQEEYYTNPDKTAEWLDAEEGIYPATARDVLIDYTLNYTDLQPPVYWLKNLDVIHAEAVDPALDLLWTGKATAQQATDEAVAKAVPLLQGRTMAR